jgi:hypothetical protein
VIISIASTLSEAIRYFSKLLISFEANNKVALPESEWI